MKIKKLQDFTKLSLNPGCAVLRSNENVRLGLKPQKIYCCSQSCSLFLVIKKETLFIEFVAHVCHWIQTDSSVS